MALAHSYEKGDLQIRHPWARATPPGTTVGVGYFEIRNTGKQPDRLLSATSPAARQVEMHISEHAGEVAKMRQLRAFEVPARERLTLEPNGAHLMLVDLVQPLKKGERVPMKLRFERAGEIDIEFEVQEMGSRHSRH
jgi:copper(I)-binding protein